MRCARSATSKALLAAVAVAFAGCGVVRPSESPATCPSYEQVIRPVVESRCGSCHGADRAEGGYAVGEYTSTVSRRPDGSPRVEPGEADTLFLQAVRGELPGHEALQSDERTRLTSWVIGCRAAPGEYQFHPRGWSTPTDQSLLADGGYQFHGRALRQQFYRFGGCQQCHGEDLRGGRTQSDCGTCHTFEQGQLACNTCHGDKDSAAPPKALNGSSLPSHIGVGAHRAHLTASPTHRAVACTECHQEVRMLEDEGHYRRNNVFQIDKMTGEFLPSEVVLRLSNDAGTASWDRAQATCTNSACHAPNPGDTRAMNQAPVWTSVGQVNCGSCHGNPPASHPAEQLACEVCHGAGYEDGGVNVETHLNGRVDYRGGGDTSRCDTCHSGPQSPRFVDLQGRTSDAGVRTVGAHDAHLNASRLRGAMTCNECHLVPATLFAPGHIDTGPPAEVFPMGFTGLSAGQAIMPVYNAQNATCTTYCHSGGTTDPDTAPGLNRTPSWTGGADQAACGTCHGLPPVDGTQWHMQAQTIGCATCHGASVEADGGLILTPLPDGGVTSRHLDGRVTGQQ